MNDQTVLMWPNKNIPVFRVTRPYLNLLVKPRFFQAFWKKIIILCILKGIPEKKNVPTLPKIFRPVTRNAHIFLFGLC